jgi:hypothetical protein
VTLAVLLALTFAAQAAKAAAVETGPVARKWGLGWDSGLTARLWLKGVWEFALGAGPNDNLTDREDQHFDTGSPPDWNAQEERILGEDKTESGFVRFQAGRLVARRGPLGLVCFSGLEHSWADSRYSYNALNLDYPNGNRDNTRDYDRSTWRLSLGLRPSFVILDFLTIETAFGLHYAWSDNQRSDRTVYSETGRIRWDLSGEDSHSFTYSGWTGMGSLQFIVWF